MDRTAPEEDDGGNEGADRCLPRGSTPVITSRFIEHLKQQHWTGVFIELAIVVLGVYIGMQVNNWNEARADRGIAARHLTEIAEDLRTHLATHKDLYGSALARIAAVDYIYDKAFGEKLPASIRLPPSITSLGGLQDWPVPSAPPIPPERLTSLMAAIDLVRVSIGSRNGYESLIASGHLGLIGNKDLARAIQNYYGRFDDLLDTGNHVFRVFRNDGAAVLYRYGVSVFDQRPPEEIVSIARDNPEFAAYLRSQREWAALHAGLLEQLRVDTVELLAKIEAELKRLQ